MRYLVMSLLHLDMFSSSHSPGEGGYYRISSFLDQLLVVVLVLSCYVHVELLK